MSQKSDSASDSGIESSILGTDEEGSHDDARDRPLADAERLTLGELTAAADVSVRTVRYYIAEGLLPPPEGSGPGSAYTQGHLDRLRLIQRLKEAYLPLKEIRRRLSGLSDDEVQERARGQRSPDRLELRRLRSSRGSTSRWPGRGTTSPCWSLASSTERSRWRSSFRRPPRRWRPALEGSDFMPEPAPSRGPRAAASSACNEVAAA